MEGKQAAIRRARGTRDERLRDFSVAKRGVRLIGCSALRVVWGGLGEVRSLAVTEDARNAGVGRYAS